MIINPAIIQYHIENRYDKIFNTEALRGKLKHVGNVIKLGMAIAKAQKAPVDNELLEICLEHHDDGRVDQMRLLGKFCDTEVSHNVLGLDRLDKFLLKQSCEPDYSVEILRNVMLYHGRQALMPDVLMEEALYVELVTAADDFENACSCVSYLAKEVENDEKDYVKSNPGADQKVVSDFVFKNFEEGMKFDKMKYCHTYSEYVLFAATLATNCIKKYENFARVALKQPGYGYSSILEGFKDVFEKTLTPEMAKEAYEILAKMVG